MYERIRELIRSEGNVPDAIESRTRTVLWQDPARFEEPIRRLSGIEFMRAFLAGGLPPPPFMQLLGVRIVSVEPSSVAFEFDPAEYMYSPLGKVHGGIITLLLDTAMGCSFHTTLPAASGYTTLELKCNFLRAVTVKVGALRAEGRVIHADTRVATAEARLVDSRQRSYAHATSTLLVLSPDSR